jgi:acetylornithine deacetylase
MDDIASLTRELVGIPSHEDETVAGDCIEEWLREQTDARVERDDHGNVIARRGDGETDLALVGHHDVVPPDDSQLDGEDYIVERNGDRLYGRGSADMKGAVAAAMCAFRDANVSGDEPTGKVSPPVDQLTFVSFVGEEVGGEGARAAIADGFVPTYAIVGEGSTGYSAPSVTDVAVAHKGRRASTIQADGQSAHASEPAAGANAIYRASDAVDEVRDLSFPETTVLGHEVQGSIAVTEIEGGSAWNVIPDSCSITIDERTVPGERAPLESLADEPGISVDIEQDLPPMACDDADFADLVLAVSTDVHAESDPDGPRPEHVSKPHATDAGWLADAGTTCLVCGPAEPGEAHTADESVSLAVLDRCYEIYRGVAERMVSSA